MKASKFSNAQKGFILKQGVDGTPVAEICRKAGISHATYFNWQKRYDGLLPTDMGRLKQLEDENTKLRKLVADASLDKEMLQDVIRRKPGGASSSKLSARTGTCRSGGPVRSFSSTRRPTTTRRVDPGRPASNKRSRKPARPGFATGIMRHSQDKCLENPTSWGRFQTAPTSAASTFKGTLPP
jgi:putative transposase